MHPTQDTVASIRKPLRRAELAELLGVTTKTIDNRRKAGDLPPSFTCGAERLWRPEDIEAWMEERVRLGREAQAAAPVAAVASAEKKAKTGAAGTVGLPAAKKGARPESAFVRRLNAASESS